MNSNTVPTEILLTIFKILGKSELKTCLLVNKAWNKVAATFFDSEIHISMYETTKEKLSLETMSWYSVYTTQMYTDLLMFPKFAAKVTKITAVTPKVHKWIPTLTLCSNVSIIDIDHKNPWELLCELEASQVQLPKLQKLYNDAPWHCYENVTYLWPCLWKFRNSITALWDFDPRRINISRFAEDTRTFLSKFPNLDYLAIFNTSIDLYGLLVDCKNITDVCIVSSTITFDSGDWSSLQTKLKELRLCGCDSISFEALRFLAQTSCKLGRSEVRDIDMISNYDQQEIQDTLGHFPKLRSSKSATSNSNKLLIYPPHSLSFLMKTYTINNCVILISPVE